MTESNPPAQPDKELSRRILLFLEEADRRGVDHPHAIEIADALNETEKVILRHSRILECDGLVKLRWYIGGGALVELLPKGLQELEKIAQTAPQPDPPPISETSSESQEFEHSPDYATVIWRGREFHFSPMQSHAVRLLHEEFQEGRNNLRDAYVIETIEAKVRTLHDLFKRSCGVWDKLIIKGERQGTHRLNLSRQVPPDSN